MDIEQMTIKLRKSLEPRRFEHSLGVMDTAVKLAECYGADTEKARIAGLLHDCAKNHSKAELYELCEKYNIHLDDIAQREAGLLHGFVGAYLLKDEYDIEDAEIFDAVYYHTIGKPDMPLLTKIIFIADCIEPMRMAPWVDEIRQEVYTDIDRALIIQLDNTIRSVLKKGTLLHTNTIDTRNFYLKK